MRQRRCAPDPAVQDETGSPDAPYDIINVVPIPGYSRRRTVSVFIVSSGEVKNRASRIDVVRIRHAQVSQRSSPVTSEFQRSWGDGNGDWSGDWTADLLANLVTKR